MVRRWSPALVLAALLAPAAAQAASLTVEGFYGLARPPSADLRSAVSGAREARDLAESSTQLVGGDVLLGLGAFQLGAVGDTTIEDGIRQTAIGGLAGFRFGDRLRLDLLGEVGGHRYGDVLEDPAIVTGSSADEWLLYVGVRPGLAFRFGPGIVLGIWGFARWDVSDRDLRVQVGDAGGSSPATVELGGTTIGATVRLGFGL